MLKLVILAICVGVIACDQDWENFKAKHKKNYKTDEEENKRHDIWKDNMDKVDAHNGAGHSFTVGENEYADLTTEEVKSTMNGLNPNDFFDQYFGTTGFDVITPTTASTTTTAPPVLPSSVDWRDHGYVTTVKNQGQCGCCWSFSAAGALEGQLFKTSGKLVNLSESNLMDCSTSFGNNGCNGGWYGNAFQYVIKNGIADLAEYPFKPKEGKCKYKDSMSVTKASSYKSVTAGEEHLKVAVATVGPVSVAIDASEWAFQMYQTGVYINPNCTTNVDHAVLVVGYGTEQGQDYWLVKNSWGPTWGEEGYIKMARNLDDQCGISSMAEYPLI